MGARKPFLLRIDAELWAELDAWAKDEFRSVNGQIEFLLKQAVSRRKGSRRETGGATPPPRSADPAEPDPGPPGD